MEYHKIVNLLDTTFDTVPTTIFTIFLDFLNVLPNFPFTTSEMMGNY